MQQTKQRRQRLYRLLLVGLLLALGGSLLAQPHAHADSPATPGDFSLQVTPSPLVTTVKPGVTSDLELKIRNGGTTAENLKIASRSFNFDDKTGQISLNDTEPADVAGWVSFSSPSFSVQPGQWYSQHVRITVPQSAGFSYSFALVINRQSDPKPIQSGRLIKGSVAIFTLVNVDKPGATKHLDVSSFLSAKHVYEYLPATLTVRLKNSGNTIVQPYGNIFIQRGSNDNQPISTLTVNQAKGYILPGTSRNLPTQWADGFPAYKTVALSNGATKQSLTWNWSKLSSLRIGRYTAKLVAVYSDGQHDVPIQGEVSFWVIPWKLLIGLMLISLILLFGLYSIIRKIINLVRKRRKPGFARPQHRP